MSSRPVAKQSSARNSYAALAVEGGDDESQTESEGELVEAPVVPTPAPAPPPAEKVKPKASKAKAKIAPAEKSAPPPPAPAPAPVVEAPKPSAAEPPRPAPIEPTPYASASTAKLSPTLSPASSSRPATLGTGRRSQSPGPPTSRFHPSLPNLPPPPASPLPEYQRKRKASQDLTTVPLHKESKIAIESASEPAPKAASVEDVNAERAKKKQNAVTRTVWTLIMIFGFIAILLLGHAYVIVLVFVCQALAYREVTALFSLTHPKQAGNEGTSDAWDGTLNWYFFAVTNYFLYGESIIYYFKHVVFSDAQFLPFATNHRFISFMLYTIGFVGFVGSLKKNYLKHQFGLFGWVHMSLLVIVVSSHFIVNNILEGLIWFWIPASLVICNDIWAYICGVTFGKTPLIKLSPKKTVEGFVGAFICTLIFAVLWGTFFMRYSYMICPVRDLGTSAWTNGSCIPNPVFIWRQFELPAPLQVVLTPLFGAIPSIPYTQFQLHCLVLATFASLVAPFGGFFASGFKRAFNLKDFGDSIPGHGGMTDRMDCQFLMGMFSYVYYSALVREHHVTVGSVLQTIVSNLSVDEQIELFHDLKRYLDGLGVPLTAQ